MTRVFVDTGYWIALLNPKDGLHSTARMVTAELEPPVHLITTEMVLVEFLNAFAERSAHLRTAATKLVAQLQADPKTLIIEQDHAQFEGGLGVYTEYIDKQWSLTDCVSYKVMSEENLTDALAHDKNFQQMNFRALLREG